MTITVNGSQVGLTQISKKEQKEQAVQRVKTEFLRQVNEGVAEKEAFKNSLKAIDEKYNPKADSVQFAKCDTVGMSTECLKAAKMSLDPGSVKTWLEIIEKALPVVLTCVTAIENFIDWIIEHKAPKNEQSVMQESLQTAKYSTTA